MGRRRRAPGARQRSGKLAQAAERRSSLWPPSSRAAQARARQRTAILQEAEEAAQAIHLDGAAPRAIIDRQLRDRSWEADCAALRYARAVREGQAMVISEWPTASGPADFALFRRG